MQSDLIDRKALESKNKRDQREGKLKIARAQADENYMTVGTQDRIRETRYSADKQVAGTSA